MDEKDTGERGRSGPAGMSVLTYREPDDGAPEVPLSGGHVTEGVVRIGDTVRRAIGFNAGLVHGLLGHLESVGFAGARRRG